MLKIISAQFGFYNDQNFQNAQDAYLNPDFGKRHHNDENYTDINTNSESYSIILVYDNKREKVETFENKDEAINYWNQNQDLTEIPGVRKIELITTYYDEDGNKYHEKELLHPSSEQII